MKADELRRIAHSTNGIEFATWEIAAQLADLNELLRSVVRVREEGHLDEEPVIRVLADIGRGGPGSVG